MSHSSTDIVRRLRGSASDNVAGELMGEAADLIEALLNPTDDAIKAAGDNIPDNGEFHIDEPGIVRAVWGDLVFSAIGRNQSRT